MNDLADLPWIKAVLTKVQFVVNEVWKFPKLHELYKHYMKLHNKVANDCNKEITRLSTQAGGGFKSVDALALDDTGAADPMHVGTTINFSPAVKPASHVPQDKHC